MTQMYGSVFVCSSTILVWIQMQIIPEMFCVSLVFCGLGFSFMFRSLVIYKMSAEFRCEQEKLMSVRMHSKKLSSYY